LRERDNHRRTVDELSRQLASIEGERRAEKEQNRQLIAERDDLAIEIRRREQAFESEVEHLRGDAEQEVERWKRMISEKEQASHPRMDILVLVSQVLSGSFELLRQTKIALAASDQR
jgi:seryl-tRNA synthetase